MGENKVEGLVEKRETDHFGLISLRIEVSGGAGPL